MPRENRTMGQRMRERIDASACLRMLAEHVSGQREMTASQVQAARVILAKVLPDLKPVDSQALTAPADVHGVTIDALAAAVSAPGGGNENGDERDKDSPLPQPEKISPTERALRPENLPPLPEGYEYGEVTGRGGAREIVKVGTKEPVPAVCVKEPHSTNRKGAKSSGRKS